MDPIKISYSVQQSEQIKKKGIYLHTLIVSGAVGGTSGGISKKPGALLAADKQIYCGKVHPILSLPYVCSTEKDFFH